MRQYIKTRIAPTPSGFLHLGNVLSFAITNELANKYGAKILLRIDDLDQQRVNKQYLQDIFDTLNFMGLRWDEGPADVDNFGECYSQLMQIPLYQEALQYLADNLLVYACTCSRRQINRDQSTINTCACYEQKIPLATANASWRLLTNNQTKLVIKTHNGRLITSLLPAEMQNFIVRKKDGQPSYQLTSVIDDLHYGIDLVVRGEDLWPSTLAQHQLAMALGKTGFSNITFYHHPLLLDEAGKKLSKSAGANSVQGLLKSGATAAGIYAIITQMLQTQQPINTWQQLVDLMR